METWTRRVRLRLASKPYAQGVLTAQQQAVTCLTALCSCRHISHHLYALLVDSVRAEHFICVVHWISPLQKLRVVHAERVVTQANGVSFMT